ncbi:MAG: flagellar filament capping protein FliD [Clostridia bacterium]|nr:flagellar filament capping protein FliD [Clostridia bacterium]
MAGSIYGFSSLSSAFHSPLKSHEVNPVSNLIYGSAASKVYSDTFARKLQDITSSYLSSLNSTVTDLKVNAKPLLSKSSDSSYNQKTVLSSDSTGVTGSATSTAGFYNYTLNIAQIAKSQVNTGLSLDSNTASSITAGNHTFSLKVGNKEAKNISFAVGKDANNKQSLEGMAKAINYSRQGVTANVISDAKSGKSYLKITSDKTGTDHAFTITGIQGNAAAVSGIQNISSNSQNAVYKVNGKDYISQNNSISLDNGKVTAVLHKGEGKDIELKVAADTKAIKSDIKDFVTSFNKITDLTNSYSSSLGSAQKLGKEFSDIITLRKTSLQSIGILVNNDRTLSVDDQKLDKVLNENVSKVRGVLAGIADKAYLKSNNVLTSPMRYAGNAFLEGNPSVLYNHSGNRQLNALNIYRGLSVDTLL